MKILVADDNTVAAEALGRALKNAETEVEVVYNGESCIARAKAAPPDLIILDMSMPGMNGAQVLKEFLKWDPKPRFKVIISTAYADWQSDLTEKTLGGTLRWSNSTVTSPHPEKSPFNDLLIGELDKSAGFDTLISQIKDHIAKLSQPNP